MLQFNGEFKLETVASSLFRPIEGLLKAYSGYLKFIKKSPFGFRPRSNRVTAI